jgi:hypothetical protein
MRVVAQPDVAEFVQAQGGRLFVWATSHRCCRGRLTLLDAATTPPRKERPFEVFPAGGFTLLMDQTVGRFPAELHLELKGRKHPHLEAYWDGCVYLI